MRLFLALHLSEDIKKTALKTIETLKLTRANVSWLEPEKMHITLKFLGDTDKSRVKGILPLLTEVAEAVKVYKITTGKLGAFPSKEDPKVVWIGLSAGIVETIDLSKNIDQALFKAAFKREEKPFNPHITIGRVKGGVNHNKLAATLSTTIIPPIEQQITGFTLVKSELRPEGVAYKEIETFGFRV